MNIVAAKLGQLGMEVTDNMLMEFVLKSLPPSFDHFKPTYSIQEHKWSLEDHTSLCTQEELRLNEVNYEAQIFPLPPNRRKGSTKITNKEVLSKTTIRAKSKINY